MMLLFLNPEDVIILDDSGTLTEAKAEILIGDTLARAVGLVPELAEELTELQFKASRGILRKAVLRWHQTGSGAIVQKSVTTGPYNQSETIDNKQTDRAIFTKAEIAELRGLFNSGRKAFKGKAFSVDMFNPEHRNFPSRNSAEWW